MRIAYIGNAASPHVHRWAQTFHGLGHETHVLSLFPPASFHYDGPQVHVLAPPLEAAPSALFPVKWTLFQRRARRTLRTIRPDLVHQIGANQHLFNGAVAGDTPFLLAVMGTDVFREPFQSRWRHRIVRRALHSAHGVLYQSRFTGQHLHDSFQVSDDRAVHLPWGIDVPLFLDQGRRDRQRIRGQLGIPKDRRIVLSPRFVRPDYNVPQIVRAFAALVAKHPDLHLVQIRGARPDEEVRSIMELVHRLGVADRFTLVDGYLPKPDLAALMSASDVFVSIPPTDQFAMTILEGMAAGSFPILTRNPVYEEYLEDGETALFVDPQDVADLRSAMDRALQDKPLRDRARRRNRDTVRRHEDGHANLLRAVALYESVLQHGTVHPPDIPTPEVAERRRLEAHARQ